MMNASKISIITVSYNAASTIEQTILSVINQDYENIEYIIIDGGSTDGSVDIIKKYEEKIFFWISEPDNGIYDAMNKGIDKATGEWVYFLGSDDSFYNKDVLNFLGERILECENKDCGVHCGKILFIDKYHKIKKESGKFLDVRKIKEGEMYPHQGMFVKRKLLEKYKFNIGFKISADYDLLLRMVIDEVKIKFHNYIVANYDANGISSDGHLVYKDRYSSILSNLNQKSAEKYKQLHRKRLIKSWIKKILFFLKLEWILGYEKIERLSKEES